MTVYLSEIDVNPEDDFLQQNQGTGVDLFERASSTSADQEIPGEQPATDGGADYPGTH